MRKSIAFLTVLAMAVSPALAQAKTKGTAPAETAAPASDGTPDSVGALSVCEAFAKGDVMALDTASRAGWDASEQEGELPFVKSYGAGGDIAGIGYGDLFALVESYPDRTLGYCRIDVAGPQGDGHAAIKAIEALGQYTGSIRTDEKGTYASFEGTDAPDTMLLTHWDSGSFVLQLTIITPKAGAAGQ